MRESVQTGDAFLQHLRAVRYVGRASAVSRRLRQNQETYLSSSLDSGGRGAAEQG